MSGIAAVLFDLDGTLVDSAPDLAGAVNEMLAARGMTELPYANLRSHGGSGARGMVGRAFGCAPDHPDYASLRDEFLQRYEQRLLRLTRAFNAVPAMLDALGAQGHVWGIVTNKAEYLARPLVEAMGWLEQAHGLVGGDTTPHRKPHPAPLLEAARRLGLVPQRCVYVGDDARDIAAGRAAGMATVAAAWGYLGEPADVRVWGADAVATEPQQLPALMAALHIEGRARQA
ncbi:MAG: phosphoglycolate phosphatase [Paucibacter sp.]|nr:phosphoglycolate phosphatase [Roseateles sp.]